MNTKSAIIVAISGMLFGVVSQLAMERSVKKIVTAVLTAQQAQQADQEQAE